MYSVDLSNEQPFNGLFKAHSTAGTCSRGWVKFPRNRFWTLESTLQQAVKFSSFNLKWTIYNTPGGNRLLVWSLPKCWPGEFTSCSCRMLDLYWLATMPPVHHCMQTCTLLSWMLTFSTQRRVTLLTNQRRTRGYSDTNYVNCLNCRSAALTAYICRDVKLLHWRPFTSGHLSWPKQAASYGVLPYCV